MDYWYYAPWQYELRERIEPEFILSPRGPGSKVPPVVRLTVLAGAVFLAYAPLLQPGPPAKAQSPYELQMYQLGGGMIV